MPIYEYKCEQGHVFEVMRRISDDPVDACQTCEAPVSRVFHPVAVHFKGKGFYNTDYGKRKRAKESDEAGKDGGAAKSDGGEKGDAKPKPDAKPEAKPAKASTASDSSS